MELLAETIYYEIENNENVAVDMYAKLIKKISDDEIKTLIKNLLEDELKHKQFFSEEDLGFFNEVSEEDLQKIQAKLDEAFPEPKKDDDLLAFLKKVAKDEEIAYNCYKILAQNLDGEAKKDLLSFAEHEKYHKEIVEMIIQKIC